MKMMIYILMMSQLINITWRLGILYVPRKEIYSCFQCWRIPRLPLVIEWKAAYRILIPNSKDISRRMRPRLQRLLLIELKNQSARIGSVIFFLIDA
jgi:hypothetical protein